MQGHDGQALSLSRHRRSQTLYRVQNLTMTEALAGVSGRQLSKEGIHAANGAHVAAPKDLA